MSNGLILLEVNEVPFKIWDRFAQNHPKSAIAQLLREAHQVETVTEDDRFQSSRGDNSPHSKEGHLTPWTTWPTVHRGVTNAKHCIHDLGQDLTDINKNYPSIWQLTEQAGKKTGVFGSLHSYPVPTESENYAFYIPDPFAAGSETIPKKAEAFQDFSLGATRASGRNVGGIDKNKALKFVLAAPSLGLRPRTIANLTKQLAHERIDSSVISRRRVFQTVVSFDIFLKMLRKNKPQFSTFFANHVAASMHRYWAAAYPEDYEQLDVTSEWSKTYKDEIEYSMLVIDNMVRDLINFCSSNSGYRLAIASSMGQEPTKAKQVKTELALADYDKFMDAMGVPSGAWSHAAAMFPNFNVLIDEPYRDGFRQAVASLKINGEVVDHRQADNGFFSIDFGHPNIEKPILEINDKQVNAEEIGVSNMKIQDMSLKCADHTAEGSLFVFDPNQKSPHTSRTQVPTTAIAPSILNLCGCPVPDYMSADSVPGLS